MIRVPKPTPEAPDRAALEREIHRLRCELRRTVDELNEAHMAVRVLRRVIARLIESDD